MRKVIIGIIIGLLLGSIGVYAVYKYHANEVSYTPSNSNFDVDNVESAINDLYNQIDITGTCKSSTGNNYICDYNFTGSYQTFKALSAGNYKIELWGASGGNDETLSGRGAYTSGKIHLDENEILYIYIGESNDNCGSSYNGGGYCGNTETNSSGGGATDIRYFKNYTPTRSDLSWNSKIGLKSRIMVAGAGGGFSKKSGYGDLKGGNAGGIIGFDSSGYYLGKGGTQISGGSSSCTYGGCPLLSSFGIGAGTNDNSNGPGGSGYYGGGAGDAYNYHTSGAGGSSYISGYLGCIAVADSESIIPRDNNSGTQCSEKNASSDITCSKHYSEKVFSDIVMKSGSEEITNPMGTTETGHLGNGYARITYLGN